MISLVIVDSFAALFFSFSSANRILSLVVIELPVAIASLASCEAALRFVITLRSVMKRSLLIISLKLATGPNPGESMLPFLLQLYAFTYFNGGLGCTFTLVRHFPWPVPSRYPSPYFPLLITSRLLLRSCHRNFSSPISPSML